MVKNKKSDSDQTTQMRGHFMTTQRRLLLEIIRDAEEHLGAKELYQRARAKDESIGPATVYRNLNLFRELGLIDERRLDKAWCCYEIKRSPEHQHLLCRACGKVIEFRNPYFNKLVKAVEKEHGFKITKAELCLEGYCPECEDKD